MTRRPVSVLVVEDNESDAELVADGLGGVHGPVDLRVVKDGREALEHLRRAGPEDPDDRPDLVLLDLNLPRKDGREVLAEVKADPALSEIPVIVLTTSSAPRDIEFAYRHHANSYVRKPLGMDRLVEAAAAIRDFWMKTATLPSSV